MMNSILIMFHCESKAAYAIDSLIQVFYEMAYGLVHDNSKIFFSFTKIHVNSLTNLPLEKRNLFEFNPKIKTSDNIDKITQMIKDNHIDVLFAFDQPVEHPMYGPLRQAGIKRIISYWGAPISSIKTLPLLLLKKLEVFFRRNSPDLYLFESQAMANTAIRGRGIPTSKVAVSYLGVDEKTYTPQSENNWYAHEQFSIPRDRKIVYFSGHMEPRKGVAVLMRAVSCLYTELNERSFHFLLLGNKPGEEESFLTMLSDDEKQHVTFAGYRKDVAKIVPCCYVGAIASTGWDSFTMSSLEIAACGVPLLVSRLQGLGETIDEGITGYSFVPGDYKALSAHVQKLLHDPELRARLGVNSRKRIEENYTKKIQISRLMNLVGKL